MTRSNDPSDEFEIPKTPKPQPAKPTAKAPSVEAKPAAKNPQIAPVRLPKPEQAFDKESNPAPVDEKFPNDLRTAFKLLTKLGLEDKAANRADEKRRIARLDALRLHCHRLQQGLPTIHMTGVTGRRNHKLLSSFVAEIKSKLS